MMPGVNFLIYGCSILLYRILNTGKNIIVVITQDRVIDEIWKQQFKTELCVLVDYSY